MENNLSREEQLFCELYASGDAPFAGNLSRCYEEVFGVSKSSRNKALRLIARKDIKSYIEELTELGKEDAKAMKMFLTENLKQIVVECTRDTYRDKRGAAMSPAALRSVAVNASKALMDMYPVKEAQVNKLNINGDGSNGITFNVIVPEKQSEETETE